MSDETAVAEVVPAASTTERHAGEESGGRRSRSLFAVLFAVFLLVHAALVFSVVRQPLNVLALPLEQRPLITPLFHNMLFCLGPAGDFFAVYHAGVKASRHENPYDGAETPLRTPYHYHYRYLPGLGATLGRALALLTPRAAYVLWACLTEAALALVLALVLRRVRRTTATRSSAQRGEVTHAREAPWLAAFVAGILLLSSPYFLELHMGQVTSFTLCLSLAAALIVGDPSLSRRWAVVGAVAFACAVEIKVFPLVLAPLFLRRARGRWALLTAGVLLAICEGPWLVRQPALYRTFIDLNFDSGISGMGTGNFGLTYVLYRLFENVGPAWTEHRFWIMSTVLKAIFLGSAVILALGKRAAFLPAAAGLVIAHMLSYAYVWEHHMSGVLPFGVALLVAHVAAPEKARAPRWLLVAALVLLALPTTFYWQDPFHSVARDPSAGWTKWQHVLGPLCKVVPLLVLYGSCVREIWRRRRESSPS